MIPVKADAGRPARESTGRVVPNGCINKHMNNGIIIGSLNQRQAIKTPLEQKQMAIDHLSGY